MTPTPTADAATRANQRYYSSQVGRFLTPDPYGVADRADPQSWNRYAYVGNDPVNFADPSGLNRLMCDVYTQFGCAAIPPGQQPATYWSLFPNMAWSAEGGWTITSVVANPTPPSSGGDPIDSGGGTVERYVWSLDKVLGFAKQALADPDCNKLFLTGNSLSPSGVLEDIVQGGGKYGTIKTVPGEGPFTSGAGLRFTLFGNDRGPIGFYYQRVNITLDRDLLGVTKGEDTTMLLHELAHAMNFLSTRRNAFVQNDSNPSDNLNNSEMIHKDCISKIKF